MYLTTPKITVSLIMYDIFYRSRGGIITMFGGSKEQLAAGLTVTLGVVASILWKFVLGYSEA